MIIRKGRTSFPLRHEPSAFGRKAIFLRNGSPVAEGSLRWVDKGTPIERDIVISELFELQMENAWEPEMDYSGNVGILLDGDPEFVGLIIFRSDVENV